MNITNMKKLVARLESEDQKVGFDMDTWFRHTSDFDTEFGGTNYVQGEDIVPLVEECSCGTVACLAGHSAIIAWEEGYYEPDESNNVYNVAYNWLELNPKERGRLFHGRWSTQPRHPELGIVADQSLPAAIIELKYLIAEEELSQ